MIITTTIQKIRKKCLFLSKNSESLLSSTTGQTIFFKEVDALIALFDSILLNKTPVRERILVFFMYQWFFASVRKSRKSLVKIRQERSANNGKINQFISRYKENVSIAVLWGLQAVSLFETRKKLKEKFSRPNNFFLESSSLKKGDVVLSYKTKKYLQKHIISRFISRACNSQITHALIVSKAGPQATLFSSSAEKDGLGSNLATPKSGEAYIILRPKKPLINTRSLNFVINKWIKNNKQTLGYKFSEIKCWIASLIGFVHLFSFCLTQRALTLANPVKDRSSIFCSEMIDNIYKEIGIYLTPRSFNSAVVGPIEFFYSPYFDLQGVIAKNKDKKIIQEELLKKYKI